MFFIDIAVPRDIDPDVNSLDNVYLYDIDDCARWWRRIWPSARKRPTGPGRSSRSRCELLPLAQCP
jgi:hypothetical protein